MRIGFKGKLVVYDSIIELMSLLSEISQPFVWKKICWIDLQDHF